MRSGAKGVKIRVAGRLDGAEIARDEWVRIGSTPLHTLRANIDYGFSEALTIYGKIGIKVWIYRGEVFKDPKKVKKDNKIEIQKTEVNYENYKLCYCSNNNIHQSNFDVHKIWNRDYNASKNILQVMVKKVKGENLSLFSKK